MEIKEILALMEEVGKSGLSEFRYEKDGEKLVLKQGAVVCPQASLNGSAALLPQNGTLFQNAAAGAAETAAGAALLNGNAAVAAGRTLNAGAASVQSGVRSQELPEESAAEQGLKTITAPMVGTFYVSSSPEKEPFVKVGDTVKRGDTVCVIEAMKLMNEIESKFAGTVEEILAENESVVEFGQPLFKIREAV